VWGTGKPKRKFLFSDDLADAVVFLMNKYSGTDVGELINIGAGYDLTIKELADIIKDIIGYKGNIVWDETIPDGTPQKLLDTSRINNLGWQAQTALKDGIQVTLNWFKNHYQHIQ